MNLSRRKALFGGLVAAVIPAPKLTSRLGYRRIGPIPTKPGIYTYRFDRTVKIVVDFSGKPRIYKIAA